MKSSTANTEESSDDELQALLKEIDGRVGVIVKAIDHLTGEEKVLCQFDLEPNAAVSVAFKNPGEDTQEEYTFAFTEDTHRKNNMNRKDKARRHEQFSQLESALGEELRSHDITADDYFADLSINFDDLPQEEKLKVLKHDLDDIVFEFERITECRNEKGGLLTRIFRRRT